MITSLHNSTHSSGMEVNPPKTACGCPCSEVINIKLKNNSKTNVGERGGESGKQVGSMNEASQVGGCYNITCIYTYQETV